MTKITRDQKRKLHDMDSAELDKLGLTKEEFQVLIESKDWATVVEGHRTFIQSIKAFIAKEQTKFVLRVNYDRSIEYSRKDGNYDWESSDITSKNFPTSREGMADIILHMVHFDRGISSEDAIAEMDKMGLRPAETHELLALGATYPNLQGTSSIVALGSVLKVHCNSRVVLHLRRHGSERNLSLLWFNYDWHTSFRFAAVQK